MANENQTELEKKPRTEEERIKKTYTKPAFRFERVFETQALTCGKVSSQFGACKTNPKTS